MPFVTFPSVRLHENDYGYVLVQDGGATGCDFGLYPVEHGEIKTNNGPEHVISRSNEHFDSYLKLFLSAMGDVNDKIKDRRILVSCNSFPGPTNETNKTATFTNGQNESWKNISIKDLSDILRCPVFTVNDLYAFGAYIASNPDNSPRNFQSFHEGSPEGNVQVLDGPGGGLNGSLILADGPVELERGHIGLPTITDDDLIYLAYLRAIKNGTPCWEDAISGPGLADTYVYELNKDLITTAFIANFDKDSMGAIKTALNSGRESKVMQDGKWSVDKTAAIVNAVRSESDPICKLAYSRYVKFLGALVSDSIKATGAKKRALLAANVRYDADILPTFKSDFIVGYNYSRKLDPRFVNDVPVDIIVNKHAPLNGMAWCAANYSYLAQRDGHIHQSQVISRMMSMTPFQRPTTRGHGAYTLFHKDRTPSES